MDGEFKHSHIDIPRSFTLFHRVIVLDTLQINLDRNITRKTILKIILMTKCAWIKELY